jgi:recombination protein RecA
MHPEISELFSAPGIPCGLITEVYGAPDSGKTTFCIEALRQTQVIGGIPALFLSELKFDLPRCKDMGVDVSRMIIKRPKTIEEVREHIHDIVTAYVKAGSTKPLTIVWDSMAATPCEKELNEKRGDFAGDNAAALTVLLRKTQAMIRDHNIAFVMINQISTKIGVTFGKKTQAKGGYAPKFYSALRMEFTKVGRIRAANDLKDADFCGIRTVVEIEKNHLGTPFKTAEFQIDYKGFVFDRKVEKKNASASKKVSKDEKGRDSDED